MEIAVQQLMSRRSLALITGIITVATGYLYAFGFEFIEQEVRTWGIWAMLGGISSVLAGYIPLQRPLIRIPVIVGYSILILAQVMPIILWIMLVPITDGPQGVVGSWLYVVPHILIVVCSFATMIRIFKEP